ncbi:head-tail connector protein [Rhizobium paknamense]|uniref:PhiE125 gp8 family phage protein n=1 Tax=Rhizobium paknamense TaxID=1206817 RepID=A0ABU0I7V6_9HYPH|nr:head-tail connector protein [Rhizobium paknamense]MDQ0454287.1 putative phiE125 gp8 family phage protein [Rhizobium paknamense]
MTYVELAAPAAEPVSLAEMKAHLRVEHADEDGLIAALIAVARAHAERETGLLTVSRAMRLYLDDWPEGEVIQIARGPVQAIDAVTVYDEDGAPFQVLLEHHLLDGEARPARLWLKERPLPGRPLNGIEIDFTAGFGEAATDVPDGLRRAIMLHAAALYGCRGVVALEDQPGLVPPGYERLIAPFCRRRL